MPNSQFKHKVDNEIATAEKHLAELKAFRRGLDFPEIEKILNNGEAVPEAKVGAKRGRKPKNSTAFGKVRAYYESNANAWATAKKIREDTKLDRGAVSAMLYVQHKDKFERQDSDMGVQWRLKESPGAKQ